MAARLFHECKVCGANWKTRDQFIAEPALELIGYQANFSVLDLGCFLFNHACGATLALEAERFADLYSGEVFEERKTGQDECPGYCLDPSELRPCPVKCSCAYVREILATLRRTMPATRTQGE